MRYAKMRLVVLGARIMSKRTFSSMTGLRQAATSASATSATKPSVGYRKPVGGFRGAILGFFVGK